MYVIKKYKSETFGNTATIERGRMKPYKEAEESISYRLCCYADYNNSMLYYCSCFETFDEAYNKLMSLSCGEWKEDMVNKKVKY